VPQPGHSTMGRRLLQTDLVRVQGGSQGPSRCGRYFGPSAALVRPQGSLTTAAPMFWISRTRHRHVIASWSVSGQKLRIENNIRSWGTAKESLRRRPMATTTQAAQLTNAATFSSSTLRLRGWLNCNPGVATRKGHSSSHAQRSEKPRLAFHSRGANGM
jgi:hypothetical protein